MLTAKTKAFCFSALFLGTLCCTASASGGKARTDAETTVQFCWASGKFDGTIYFAEAVNREDRSGSFATLLEISGIDHHPVNCSVLDEKSYRRARSELMDAWSAAEFEVINTTFMSDLDY